MILEFHSGTVTAKLEASQKVLLSDVSFSLRAGERLALIGETGSGKTMTAIHGAARNRAKTPRAGAFEGLRTSDIGLRKSSVVRSPMSFATP